MNRHSYLAGLIALMTSMVPSVGWAQLSREDLANLRERTEVEQWTFTMAESAASRRPMDQLCGAVEPPGWRSTALFDNRPVMRDLPASFDWRDYNACTPIRDQENCGSCWAFGAIGAMESMIQLNESQCVGGGNEGSPCYGDDDCPDGYCDMPFADLSEQWLVSCTGAGSCSGGWYTHALEHLKLNGLSDPCGNSGAVLEADFPYESADVPCDCPYSHPHSIFSWVVVGSEETNPTTEQIKQAILDHGPVISVVRVTDPFAVYDGGVFNACKEGRTNHIVDLVGWDDTQGTAGAWILRNSWNTDWGIDGYMLIEYGCSEIGTTTSYLNYASEDCNDNAIPDRCDIDCGNPGGPCDIAGCGMSLDCNGNNRPDECDLLLGMVTDYNGNGIPDDCEDDCNGNDIPDECDLTCSGPCAVAPGCGESLDCQPDGIPDDCQVVGAKLPQPVPSCSEDADYGQPWCDGFESYPLGVLADDYWDGWSGDPARLGIVTDEQNHTPGGFKSLKIIDHDTLHICTGYDDATCRYWVFSTWVYIPSTMTGTAYLDILPLLDGPTQFEVSVELNMNVERGIVKANFVSDRLPLITDEWVEIRCEIDVATDWVIIYYGGQFLTAYPWSINGGSPRINAVSLWGRDTNGFYYDDVSLYPALSKDCNTTGVPDDCDIAQGTSEDENGNGLPDECEGTARRPMAEDCATIAPGDRCSASGTCVTDDDCTGESRCIPSPGDQPGLGAVCYVPKARYLSISRNPLQVADSARRVKLSDGTLLGWVGEPYWIEPTSQHDGLWLADIQEIPIYETVWPDVVHVVGCEIAHAALCDDSTGEHCGPNACPGGPSETCYHHCYQIQAIGLGADIGNEDNYSEALELCTPTTWGDTVSTCAGNVCRPPNGVVGLDDVQAAIKYYQNNRVAPITWLDIDPSNASQVPNQNLGIGDILKVIDGFQSKQYPGDGPKGCS